MDNAVSFRVDFNQSVSLDGHSEWPDIWDITGTVIAEDGDGETEVGQLMAFLVKEPDYENTWVQADAHSQEALDLVVEMSKSLPDLGTLLYVSHVAIKDEYRGRDLGLSLVDACLTRFGEPGTLAVVKPFPLQFCGGDKVTLKEYKERGFTGNQRKAFKSLRSYWSRLGFKRIAKTEYFSLDLDCIRPSWR
jgi:GNAT superfamily N-acetyltransferase